MSGGRLRLFELGDERRVLVDERLRLFGLGMRNKQRSADDRVVGIGGGEGAGGANGDAWGWSAGGARVRGRPGRGRGGEARRASRGLWRVQVR